MKTLFVSSLYIQIAGCVLLSIPNSIDLFYSCLIHIKNYPLLSNPFIESFPNSPIILSQYNTTNENDLDNHKLTVQDEETNSIRKIVRNIPCTANFYFLLPPNDRTFAEFDIRNRSIGDKIDTRSLSVYTRDEYHILVKSQSADFTIWSKSMSTYLLWYPCQTLLVFECILSPTNTKDEWSVHKFYVGLKTTRSTNTREFKEISDLAVSTIYNQSLDAPEYLNSWITYEALFVDYNSQDMIVHANLAVQNRVSFIQFPKYYNHSVPIDLILFSLLVPNVTFVRGGFPLPPERALYCETYGDDTCDNYLYKQELLFNMKTRLTFIVTDEHFSFISCGSLKTTVAQLKDIFSVFDVSVWFGITLSVICVSAILTLQHYQEKNRRWGDGFIDGIFLGVALLFEQSQDRVFKLSNLKHIFILGSLAICALILSNAFKGMNVSIINAPVVPKPFKTFLELINARYRVYSKIDSFWSKQQDAYQNLSTMQQVLEVNLNNEVGRRFILKIGNNETLNGYIKNILVNEEEYLSRVNGWNNHSYLRQLGKCDNFGLTGWENELNTLAYQFRTLMHNRNLSRGSQSIGRGLSVGTEVLFLKSRGLSLQYWIQKRVFYRMNWLRASGIVDKWLETEHKLEQTISTESLDFTNLRQTSDFEATSTEMKTVSENMETIFILGLYCALFSLLH